ncbi:MAG TPA: saccharopine dehydrogenase NADP-binding domain-containing protein [Gaiellaceae bacterium]|nr:saccharopine dehydrogenase NADP-binding domain-containing protein [Gaiellaceae bacterium]
MIAVIGAAGTIGRQVVAFLDEWGVESAGRDARLHGDEHVDARDASSLAAALEGVNVCVNCTDYRLNLDVMQACLRAGAHYVDLGGLFHTTLLQLALDDEFCDAGLTAILGLGSAPGKTNLLARAAVERLAAQPVALELWAASRDPAAAGHPLPAPYSVRTLLDELRLPPMVVADGELREAEPLSGEAERGFPEPVGRAVGLYTLHSELATLPVAYPTLREASFRLSLPPGLIEQLLALGDDELPEPYGQSRDAVAVHLAEARAEDGRSVTGFTVTRGGSARSTAEPAARCAVELAEDRLEAPGVSAPESAIPDPEGFLALLDTETEFTRGEVDPA